MTAVQAQWSPVQHLILGEDPQLRIYAEVSVWFKKIELFRKGEDERMFLQEPTPEDLAVHKTLLQRLIWKRVPPTSRRLSAKGQGGQRSEDGRQKLKQ